MQERWNIRFSEEELEQLIGVSFVHDGREIPPELEEVVDDAGEDVAVERYPSRLEFWQDFVQYLQETGRSDIKTLRLGDRHYLDVNIGADGYHLFFSIPYAKSMQVGIYSAKPDACRQLWDKKERIEEALGMELQWGAYNPAVKVRALVSEGLVNVLERGNREQFFGWFVETYDRMIGALVEAGETFMDR